MPRAKVLHLNSPEDDEHTFCGRRLAKVQWTLEPAQATCIVCRAVLRVKAGPRA
jgi:hypothetical protein